MLSTADRPRKYELRPDPCRWCGSPAWWDGSRSVAAVRKACDGSIEHDTENVRRRAKCSSEDCPAGSRTVYEHDDYPHRVFQLEVLVSAVLTVVIGARTMTAAAAEHLCSRDSVRRWRRWIDALAEPGDLEQLCARLDPDALPPPTDSPHGRTAQVIALLDRLADLLALKGLPLKGRACGLVRVLRDQLVRFGEVFRLTRASPPLRADRGLLPL